MGAEVGAAGKFGVHIHARTHPIEVQGWWVTNEMINLLLSDDPIAVILRQNCVFNIVPMYNPDGVEHEYPRENANGIDIESNWDADTLEPEVAVLKKRFVELMASDTPIDIALNMHSASQCNRFFWFHDTGGTSAHYTDIERDFIGAVRSHFITGIQPWDHAISWKNATSLVYPESWFWNNHGENVIALTYEDMNCESAGMYDSTAYAMLHGIGEYLDLQIPVALKERPLIPGESSLSQNYPNPCNPFTVIPVNIPYAADIILRFTI